MPLYCPGYLGIQYLKHLFRIFYLFEIFTAFQIGLETNTDGSTGFLV
jgi:hypothetical protein